MMLTKKNDVLAPLAGIFYVIHLLEIIGESKAHGAHVSEVDSKRWSLHWFLLLTAWCRLLLAFRGYPLSSTHPIEQASHDGAAPY